MNNSNGLAKALTDTMLDSFRRDEPFIIGLLRVLVVYIRYLNGDYVKSKVRDKGAFYGLIKEKQPKVVKIDYIDKMGDAIAKEEYHTEEEVGDDIYKGLKIYA